MQLSSLSLICCLLVSAWQILPAPEKVLIGYEPSCWAKIYVSQTWPIEKLPESPIDTLTLEEVPIVTAHIDGDSNQPNLLLKPFQETIKETPAYAVEIEGFILAEQDGVYTIGASSDDPLEIYVEGRLIATSSYSIPIDLDYFATPPRAQQQTQGSVKLAAGKYYHVSIINRQRWQSYGPIEKFNRKYTGKENVISWAYKAGNRDTEHFLQWKDFESYNTRRGAAFRAWLQFDSQEAINLPLLLPIYDD